MPQTQPNRSPLLDASKGVAIMLVVLGHAIQQLAGLDNRTALDLGIERFIISFHMPLFMLISGYLLHHSLQRHEESDIIKHRCRMFAYPILTLAVIRFLRWHLPHTSWSSFPTTFLHTLLNTLWFFWGLLIITALVCMVHKWLKGNWWGYFILIGLTLCLPNIYPLRAYVHLLPVFLLGYAVAACRARLQQGTRTERNLPTIGRLCHAFRGWMPVTVLVVSAGAFLWMFPFFGYDDMIYFSRYSLLGSQHLGDDVKRDLLRFGIGVSGSLLMITALHLVIRFRVLKGKSLSWLTKVGRMTFGIYVFQDLLLLVFAPAAKLLNSNYYILNATVSFLLLFYLAVWLTHTARKHPLASRLFLGT